MEGIPMQGEAPKVLILGVYEGGSAHKKESEEHLYELEQLIATLGFPLVGRLSVPLRHRDAATYLGSGKVEELMHHAHAIDADLLVIDDEISPAQQRNLEKLLKIAVIDRTEVILEVFSQHAKSAEAKLQIELACAAYEMPRLKRLWTHLSRQRGGGVNARGEGEKQIELDRRVLKKRMEQLHEELKEVEEHRKVQRSARQRHHLPLFAIIGYTNVGKSTLLNALTDAGVLVEDKLFATLDTKTRKFHLPNHQEVLLTDTVGFIRKLPHGLVAAFRSTLEEALYADILIHLVDSSHPMVLEQIEATKQVLKELGLADKPMIMVLNKWDKPSEFHTLLKEQYPDAIALSALQKSGFPELIDAMVEKVSDHWPHITLRIPQSDFKWVHEISQCGHIDSQEYDGNDILLQARVPQELYGRLKSHFSEEIC